MPSTSSLLTRLKKDFPAVSFIKSNTFRWSPVDHSVYYIANSDKVLLLHEVAHAVLGHTEYTYDIELLRLEREAWDFTVSQLSQEYGVDVQEEQAEGMLDTYRDWLHDRSLCPSCQATGMQTDKNRYSCLACKAAWHVNEARTCALRRYKAK